MVAAVGAVGVPVNAHVLQIAVHIGHPQLLGDLRYGIMPASVPVGGAGDAAKDQGDLLPGTDLRDLPQVAQAALAGPAPARIGLHIVPR